MIANTHYGYVKKAGKLQFTYTGQYNQREDGVVELLTSGTLVFIDPAVVDVFCVGGGGGGASRKTGVKTNGGFGGGGGGYTATTKSYSAAGSYLITIGAGGAAMSDGEATSFGNVLIAQGGTSHANTESHNDRRSGSAGGSGGGAGVLANSNYGAGGSDGGNGESGFPNSVNGGEGQGSTTREFGALDGKLYAGGGGGGRYISGSTPVVSSGGSGGGGTGAWYGASGVSHPYQAAAAGGANTGGGGGGGAQDPDGRATPGASGGSGIVCFRTAK